MPLDDEAASAVIDQRFIGSDDDSAGEPARKSRKTRGKKGFANIAKLATTMTPQKRVLDFPKGEFVVRNEQMWCSTCGVIVRHNHANFGRNHLKTSRHAAFKCTGKKSQGIPCRVGFFFSA